MNLSNTVAVQRLEPVATPRIAALVEWLYDAVGGLLRSTAQESPRITDASMVRRMADRLIYSDPTLAADLYAAASRHERFNEDFRPD
ncbi:MAG: hypothetical protein ABS84_04250 [Rubrivivax sp. SCN 71-131]|nr:MAG: hypothetical protein ABS84_04250 [Rubrivivax sp. SCN 71-131]